MFDPRDLRVPLVGAPMAGGASRPALAAAVSDAGGLGFLAAGYKSVDKVASEVAEMRRTTSGPVGLNLFVGEPHHPPAAALDDYRRSLEAEAARLGVALGDPRWDDDGWEAKVALALDVRPDVVSFTFGCPTAEVLRRLAEVGIHSTVTVTTVSEAREAVRRGAGSLCVQGPEAGGHRGVWDPVAVPDDRVGLHDLLADEAGTHPVHRAALVDPTFIHTERTRAFTGRWARALSNRFIREHADAPAAYPQVHHLTAPLRAAALASGDVQTAHLWAGTGHTAVRDAPARQVIRSLTP